MAHPNLYKWNAVDLISVLFVMKGKRKNLTRQLFILQLKKAVLTVMTLTNPPCAFSYVVMVKKLAVSALTAMKKKSSPKNISMDLSVPVTALPAIIPMLLLISNY